jgi:hypothetical protein
MQHLAAEAERARRLAATSHDSKLTRELTAYAAELERVLACHRRTQSSGDAINL